MINGKTTFSKWPSFQQFTNGRNARGWAFVKGRSLVWKGFTNSALFPQCPSRVQKMPFGIRPKSVIQGFHKKEKATQTNDPWAKAIWTWSPLLRRVNGLKVARWEWTTKYVRKKKKQQASCEHGDGTKHWASVKTIHRIVSQKKKMCHAAPAKLLCKLM